jgi:hypothetical protein
MAEKHAVWVYAVTSAGVSELGTHLTDVTGLDCERVRIVDMAGLAAVVSSVDGVYATGDALQRRLGDLKELESIALVHHGVVEQVATHHQVLPLRLATVYFDDDGVRDMLSDRHAEFAAALGWLNQRTECGVKVWARAVSPPKRPVAVARERGTRPQSSHEGTGTAYLLQRSASRKARDDHWQRGVTGGEKIHEALGALAVASRRHATQDARLDDNDGQMVLNGAYLVDADRFAEFEAAARAMADRMFRVDVTGPWPPYSFAGGAHVDQV